MVVVCGPGGGFGGPRGGFGGDGSSGRPRLQSVLRKLSSGPPKLVLEPLKLMSWQ